MPLHWTDTDAIALALHAAYPDTDRTALALDDLSGMVRGLSGFSDTPTTEPRRLEHILWTWMRMAGDAGGCRANGTGG